MNNNKLIVLQEKSTAKANIFTISEDSKLIPLFNNKEDFDLLFFEKQLPYFDGIELMLNDKYVFKEISQESWDKSVKLLDLSQYKKVVDDNWVFYKKDNKIYIEQYLKTYRFYLDHWLIWSVIESEIDNNNQLIKKITKSILEEIYKCKVYTISSSVG